MKEGKNKMERTRKNIILLTAAFILVAVIGATFAYFTAQIGSGANVDIKANTDTVDALRFEVDGALTINANMDNFKEGAGNLENSTKARAILLANNTNNTATYNYYVYLDIEDNDFIYTQSEDQTPELVLVVKDPTGKYLDTLGDLNKTQVDIKDTELSTDEETKTKQVTGFDITNITGLIKLSSDGEEISSISNGEVTEEWEVTLVFVNFEENQNENTNKELNAKLYIQAEERPEITISTTDKTETSMKVHATINTTKEVSKVEFKTGEEDTWYAGTQVEDTNEYTYDLTNLNANTKYKINVKVTDIDNNETTKNKTEKTIKLYTLTDVCPTGGNFAECVQKLNNQHPLYEETNLYYHNDSLDGGAQDNSYRYAGNNPNNFVCFGSGAEGYTKGESQICPDANLYRIIGAFDVGGNYRVKLIKSEYINKNELGTGSQTYGDTSSALTLYSGADYTPRVKNTSEINGFYWNTTKYESWEKPSSNKYNLWEYKENVGDNKVATLNEALNGYYLNTTIGATWASKIADTTWHIGGGDTSELYNTTPYNALQDEMDNTTEGSYPAPQTTSQAKIGLMYVSDYGYAAENVNNLWTKELGYGGYNIDDNRQNNWMYNGVHEWTISRDSDNSFYAFIVGNYGYVGIDTVNSNTCGVRPVFYLNSVTKLKLGESADGSQAHPYGIE